MNLPPKLHYLSTCLPENVYSARDCLESKEAISFCTSRLLVLQTLPPKLPAFACCYLSSRVNRPRHHATGALLPLPLSSHVMWHLTPGYRLSAPCQAADISFALGTSQQYENIIGKLLCISPILISASNPPFAISSSGFKRDDNAQLSILICSSRAPMQHISSIACFRDTTFVNANRCIDMHSSASCPPSHSLSSAVPIGKIPNRVCQ